MYQQVSFDDTLAQYMRMTPLAYTGADTWWAVGEVQLYHQLPEPAAWAMLLLGLAALGVYRKIR